MSDDEVVPGLIIKKGENCPRCGSPTFRKPCPCFIRNRGYATCAKCLNPKCAYTFGVNKAAKKHRNSGYISLLRSSKKRRR